MSTFAEHLEKYSVKDLKKIAEYYDISFDQRVKKSWLIKLIKDKIIEQDQEGGREEEKKYSVRIARILESVVK